MEDNDNTFMDCALDEARKAFAKGEVPVGAVAVYNGKIIARAHNLVESTKNATAHAEMLVLQKCFETLGLKRLYGVTIYSTLEPCPMCAGALIQSRVDRLVFGTFDPKTGACGSVIDILGNRRFNHLVEVTGLVREKECSSILSHFFEELRKENRK